MIVAVVAIVRIVGRPIIIEEMRLEELSVVMTMMMRGGGIFFRNRVNIRDAMVKIYKEVNKIILLSRAK